MAKKHISSGSGLSGAILAGALTLLLGGALGLASLISQPVSMRTKAPDPESVKPGEVVIVRGERTGRTAWRGKEQAWLAGQVNRLILTEVELNQWSEERLAAPETEAEETPGGWLSLFRMSLEPINFRIQEDGIQLVTEVSFPALLPGTAIPYRVTGRLEPVPGGVRFQPVSGTLGAAPLGGLPVIGTALFNCVKDALTERVDMEPYLAAYEDLDSVETGSGQLILLRGLGD